jgi:hypothetical protein
MRMYPSQNDQNGPGHCVFCVAVCNEEGKRTETIVT